MKKANIGKIFRVVLVVLAILVVAVLSVAADRYYNLNFLDKFFPSSSQTGIQRTIIKEESDVIGVVNKVGPSVVTITAETPAQTIVQFSPFSGFTQGTKGGEDEDIGSGFVVTNDGLIVTNKHVVANNTLTYKVSMADGNIYEVKEIAKDPNNDIAVLKIDATGLTPLELGDSSVLQVGQSVIAIGTALGEFRNTVTTGVVSGLGRGIYATGDLQSYVERIDDVIQTDAAINLGNSGGPLLNSAGQVIGVNVAVANGANNIAFAIPVNTIKENLETFKLTGKFPARAYLGVTYQKISKQAALLNEVPQGMYVVSIVSGSPAANAGIKVGDIIYKIDGNSVGTDDESLGEIISGKKPGDTLSLEVWRDGGNKSINVTLGEFLE